MTPSNIPPPILPPQANTERLKQTELWTSVLRSQLLQGKSIAEAVSDADLALTAYKNQFAK
jgi:hypothetical protein